MPESAVERAEIRLWTYWSNQIFKPDLDAYKYAWSKLAEEERAGVQSRLAAHLAKLGEALGAGDYLMGEKLTLADIHVFPLYRQLQKAQPDFRERFKTVEADRWLERITARPSFARVMNQDFHPGDSV